MVGGTGLYMKALISPFDTIDIPPDRRLRKKLHLLSVVELQNMTTRGTMNQSDWNNPRRLIRKIEVIQAKPSILPVKKAAFDYLMIGLTAPTRVLDERIDARLRDRVRRGLDKEVTSLLGCFRRDLPSMSAIGLNEHAYARRQLTWFRKQQGIRWFDVTDPECSRKVVALVGAWYTRDTYV